jgi:small subunit ribosomal protein S16
MGLFPSLFLEEEGWRRRLSRPRRGDPMVKLRFMRIGKKNRPHFRLCAMDSRRPRDGKYIEWLGVYDPLIQDDTKKFRVNKERTEYWLRVGAQPSETVYSFLKRADVQGLVRIRKPARKRKKSAASVARASVASAAASSSPSSPTSTRKPKPPKKARLPKGKTGEGEAASSSPK